MTDLTVRRLTATVQRPASGTDPKSRITRVLEQLADHRLSKALPTMRMPPGHWCLRSVDVDLVFDDAVPDAELGTRWAESMIAAVRRHLDDGRAERAGEFVHYRRPEEAVDDVVSSLALGDVSRAWAWRQLGVLAPDDPPVTAAPGEAVLAMLARWPSRADAAVVAAVEAAGLRAVHRLLGEVGWQRLAGLAAAALGSVVVSGVPGVETDPVRSRPGEVEPTVRSSKHPVARARSRGATTADDGVHDQLATHREKMSAAAQAEDCLNRSRFAVAVRRSAVRVERPTRRAWALLAVVEADPGALRRSNASALVDAVAARLQPFTSKSSELRDLRGWPGADQPFEARPGVKRPSNGSALVDAGADRLHPLPSELSDRGDLRESPGVDQHSGARPRTTARSESLERSDNATGLPRSDIAEEVGRTQWAGLLFLVAAAADAGVPERLQADEDLVDRSIRWVLHKLAQRLAPVPPHDPAALAFAGLSPTAPGRHNLGDPATPNHDDRLRVHARRWAEAVAERLDRADEDPFAVVAVVARRDGLIVAEPAPGWIEVVLRLDHVDIAVRRAGLDLDPGWVPWLGSVVRFRYE